MNRIDSLLLIIFIMGIGFTYIGGQRSSGLGYRGPSFYFFGFRVWKLTNRVLGLLLILVSFLLFVINHVIGDGKITKSELHHHYSYIGISVIVAIILTELVTFVLMPHYKPKRKLDKL